VKRGYRQGNSRGCRRVLKRLDLILMNRFYISEKKKRNEKEKERESKSGKPLIRDFPKKMRRKGGRRNWKGNRVTIKD